MTSWSWSDGQQILRNMCYIVSVFSFIRPPWFFQVIGETWNFHILYGWSNLSSTGIVVDRVQLKFFGITFVIVVPNTTFWSFSKLLSLSALSEWIVKNVQYWRLVSTRKADLSTSTSRTNCLMYSRVVVDPCMCYQIIIIHDTSGTSQGPCGCRLVRVDNP